MIKKSIVVILLTAPFLVFFALWEPETMLAQVTYGGFRGVVTDPSGAAAPSVTVTVTSKERGFTRTVVTGPDGSYEIPSLLDGTYTLTAELQGFKKYINENLVLYARDLRRVDIQLQVGEVTQEITVEGQAALINTESASLDIPRPEVWQVFQAGERGQAGMPEFELFKAGQQGHFALGGGGASFIWINHGAHGLEMRGSHDGMEASNLGYFRAPQFAFKETSLHIVNAPAEFQTSGTAQAITRGGTNDFHGVVLLQVQNQALDALGPDATSRPPGRPSTEWELTAGGPLRVPKVYDGRNRTFWNFLTRQRRSDTFGFTNFVYPQPAMRRGDLSIFPSPIKDPTTGQPFPGSLIPEARISPVAAKIMSLYMPLPNRGGPNNLSDNHTAQSSRRLAQKDYNFRVDQKIGQGNTVSVIFYRLQNEDAGLWDWNPTDGGTNAVNGAKSIALQDSHAFGSGVVNEFGFSRLNIYNHAKNGNISGRQFLQSIGLTNLGGRGVPDSLGAPRLNVPGFGFLGGGGQNIVGRGQGITDQNDIRYIVRDNVSLQKGRHVLKGGFSLQRYVPNNLAVGGNSWGTYNFDGFATGNPFADFLLGIPQSTSITRPRGILEERHSEVGFYFQDDFKVTPNLTWNLGLRYQAFTVPIDKNGLFYNFDVSGLRVVVRDDAAKSAVHPAYPKEIPVVTASQAGYPKNLVNADWKGWEPRIGVAWRPWGNKLVIRSGWGIYHPNYAPNQPFGLVLGA